MKYKKTTIPEKPCFVVRVVCDGSLCFTVCNKDYSLCLSYMAGLDMDCNVQDSLRFTHLGESRQFGGTLVHFRAEVGLLTRNIVIQVFCFSWVCTHGTFQNMILNYQFDCNMVIVTHVYPWISANLLVALQASGNLWMSVWIYSSY